MARSTDSGVSITGAISSIPRAAEVARALVQFGFGELLREIGLDRFVIGRRPKKGKGKEKGREKGEDEPGLREPIPVRVRMLLEALGPTFIKIGQIASTRADLVPPDWIDELKKLQSDVPAAPWEGDDGVAKVLDDELGADRLAAEFTEISEAPLAAASMAQVHRATLASGEQVVIKILRPGLREEMSSDIELMRVLAKLVRGHLEAVGFDVDAVVEEFSAQLMRETDFRTEARSTERLAASFDDHDGVGFPKVYHALTTRSVLVLEEVSGDLLAHVNYDDLDDATRETIARNAADAVFRQTLEIGFFHADPHPGNVFMQDGGRLCFIDCGMTGLIDPGSMTQLASIVHGVINGDLERVVRVAVAISRADPAIQYDRGFRADTWKFIDRFQGGTLESLRMGDLLDQFFALIRGHRLTCPADIVYLIKAITTIEGVVTSVSPSFDLAGHVRPYVERLIRKGYSFDAFKDRVQGSLVNYGDLIERLPAHTEDLLRAVRENRLSLKLEHNGVDRLTAELERASMNISWSLGVASLVVGASVLMLADSVRDQRSLLSVIAGLAIATAAVMAISRVVRSWWRSR